jgi:hypothetical protein
MRFNDKINNNALAAQNSRQRIRIRNRRPGFKSRQGLKFLDSHRNAVV